MAACTRRCLRWPFSRRRRFLFSLEGLTIGPYLEDRTPIRFAALLAREIGGFVKPDGYDAS
jgi:hypothetical protein